MTLYDLDKAKVLIVDDQPINIYTAFQALKEHYEIFMAHSGVEALAFCERQRPDIILCDVHMPKMNGLELCQTLKENALYADIPVIFITAFTGPEDEIACWEAGANDFVLSLIHI